MTTFREIKDASLQPAKAVSRKEQHGGHIINGLTTTHSDGGPAWLEGLRNATPVQHTNGKNDGKDIGRPKPITY